MRLAALLLISMGAEGASLRGLVRSEATRAPIERALLRLTVSGRTVETRTGIDGRFSFSELPAGRYSLQAGADGYLPYRPQLLPLTATADLRDFEIKLLPEMRIEGVVTKAKDDPASAVTVEAQKDGVAVATDWTDANGVFRLTGLGPGAYEIVAVRGITWEASNGTMFAETKLDRPVEAGGTKRVELRLKRLPVYTVRMKAAPGETVALGKASETVPANGCVVFENVFGGTYRVGEVDVKVPGPPGC